MAAFSTRTGSHNFAADRHAAEAAERIMPGIAQVARLNRAFLGRVVRFMIDQGIRQFLDLGSGIPTVGNVHQVAERAHPGCRVVYVDRDPIAVAHSELMLAANDHAAIVQADIQYPDDIFSNPQMRRLVNLDEPAGVLMLALLHWIPDEADPAALVADYRRRVPVGSYLAISHLTATGRPTRSPARSACSTAPKAQIKRRHDRTPKWRPCSATSNWSSPAWSAVATGGPAGPATSPTTRKPTGRSTAASDEKTIPTNKIIPHRAARPTETHAGLDILI